MLKPEIKEYISKFVQELLQEIHDDELPDGEISFLLHINGASGESWANIRNMKEKHIPAPMNLLRNTRFDNLDNLVEARDW